MTSDQDIIKANYDKLRKKYLAENDTPEKICNDIKKCLMESGYTNGVVEYAALNKMMGLSCIATNDEERAVVQLVESHAVLHREQVHLRYVKNEIREKCGYAQAYGVNPAYLDFNVNFQDDPVTLKSKLAELPKEWYIVQITKPHKISLLSCGPPEIHPLHIIVLPTGSEAIPPFSVTLPKPDNSSYDLCKDIKDYLESNKSDLQALYNNSSAYWQMRKIQNNRLKTAVNELEHTWLREWRILFIADPLEPSEIITELIAMVDKLINDDPSAASLQPKHRWQLRKVATCSGHLNRNEIARLITTILPNHKKLAKNLMLSICTYLPVTQLLRNEKRKTTVLIVDEDLDYLPFEAMIILQDHPVTRFQSLHVAYAMFKEHEGSIVDGCAEITIDEASGIGIVNPSNNLPKMERRLRVFIDYWLPQWKTIYSVPPEEEEYVDALLNQEILMYNGHGNGIQYLPSERIEKLRIRAAVLLFGCSSIKLIPIGGRFPPVGISNQYLTACSPCTLGMMWEVTDLDTDRMTSCFMSKWVPSAAKKHWKYVDLEKWASGSLVFKDQENTDVDYEPEMLRAVAMAKKVCTQFTTSAAAIVRGLPVRIKWKK